MEETLNETTRKLASVRVIKELKPIEGADLIELAIVDGWQVVTAKDNGFKVGDLVVYCEIDSFLPIKPEFEFLRKSSLKKMGDQEGFRLKTIRLRGQVSQGLILPINVAYFAWNQLREIEDPMHIEMVNFRLQEGDDVTALLGITKYERPIPAELAGTMRGNFPSFIPKTDEERVQNIKFDKIFDRIYNQSHTGEDNLNWIITEKLEGTSTTFYRKDEDFGVCSRNIDLLETDHNAYWKMARKLEIEAKLKALIFNVALQGELIGPGIQGNHYQLTEPEIRFFSAWNIDEQRYLNWYEFLDLLSVLELNKVPALQAPAIEESQFNVDFWVNLAQDMGGSIGGYSAINSKKLREGIVIRTPSQAISFKAISNKYLLKQED